MIVYDLTCSSDHAFEAWFKSADDYLNQTQQGLLTCPVCGDAKIHKALSVINIAGPKSNQKQVTQQEPLPQGQQPASKELVKPRVGTGSEIGVSDASLLDEKAVVPVGEKQDQQHGNQRILSSDEVVAAVQQFVRKNFVDVGDDFASEARKMHYGETDIRPIHGQASADEIADLSEEGIESVALPKVSSIKKH